MNRKRNLDKRGELMRFAVFVWLLVACTASLTLGAECVDPTAARLVSSKPIDGRPISFLRDVAPALTNAGCNIGACHGSFQRRRLCSRQRTRSLASIAPRQQRDAAPEGHQRDRPTGDTRESQQAGSGNPRKAVPGDDVSPSASRRAGRDRTIASRGTVSCRRSARLGLDVAE